MSQLERRKIQTKVKHEILQQYLPKWGFIICGGLGQTFRNIQRKGRAFQIRFVYIDCFAYTGRYAPENGEPVFGSPIIGIDALAKIRDFASNRKGFTPEVISILFEKDRDNYKLLHETLDLKTLTSRVRDTKNFASLSDGDIAIVHGDYHDYLDQLLRFTGEDYTWAFYLLDPYGSSGIPLGAVAPIISQTHNDVMINFPYNDLHRKTGPAVRYAPKQEKHLKYNDEMYGSQEWREIARTYYTEESEGRRDEMESELVDNYRDILQQQDLSLAIKTIRLKFPELERTMFYLFLTTHDPTGALTLNEILDEANQRQYELRAEHRNIRGESRQTTMFDYIADPGLPKSVEPDIDHIASMIYGRCKRSTIEFREVLRLMIDEPYYLNAIKKAMTKLKQKKLASYDGKLSNSLKITFK